MIKLFYNEKNEVTLIYYAELPEELKTEVYMEVKELPIVEETDKQAILMADGKKCWYEYKEIENINPLEKRMTELEIALTEILGGGEL
ncbi:hypothetical protein [Peptoniphilus asaccharolyticus]